MNKIVTTAPYIALLTRDNMDDLGEWLRREPGSREAFVRNATEALYAFHEWGGKIVTPEGGSIDIVPGLCDDIHGEGSSGEWISEQRRREQAARAPRKTLLGRLRVYDGLARLTGRPTGRAARREEVTATRRLLGQLTPAVRTYYRSEVRELRKSGRLRDLRFGAAVRRLRIDCFERSERERRAENSGRPVCPDCGRVIQRWPEEVGPWCKRCGNPNALPKRP